MLFLSLSFQYIHTLSLSLSISGSISIYFYLTITNTITRGAKKCLWIGRATHYDGNNFLFWVWVQSRNSSPDQRRLFNLGGQHSLLALSLGSRRQRFKSTLREKFSSFSFELWSQYFCLPSNWFKIVQMWLIHDVVTTHTSGNSVHKRDLVCNPFCVVDILVT